MQREEFIFNEDETEVVFDITKGDKKFSISAGELLMRYSAERNALPLETLKDAGDTEISTATAMMAWILRKSGVKLNLSQYQVLQMRAENAQWELKKSSHRSEASSLPTESIPNEDESVASVPSSSAS